MNPLSCIALVLIDRDRANPIGGKSPGQCQIGLEAPVRTVSYTRPSLSVQVSSADTESDRVSTVVNHNAEDAITEARYSKAYGGVSGRVAGILYKWVNYGKGWRSRWFALEDGVKEKMRID
jgi:hypothetical protein